MPKVLPENCPHPKERLVTQPLDPTDKNNERRKHGFYTCARCHSEVFPFGERRDHVRISERVLIHAGDRVSISNDGARRLLGTFYFAEDGKKDEIANVLTGEGWRSVYPDRLKRSKV